MLMFGLIFLCVHHSLEVLMTDPMLHSCVAHIVRTAKMKPKHLPSEARSFKWDIKMERVLGFWCFVRGFLLVGSGVL